MTRSRPRCSTPTQARCHSEADLREAAKLSTSRRQNSDHGGSCSIRSRRRSASRRHLSRPSVSCFTDAEKNASLACASSLIERDCSTSMRKRFISMSSSFSSRRMTGNGSGASQGWGPRNGVMMTTFAAALIWRAIACRSVVYSRLRYGLTLAGVRQSSATFTPQKLPKAAQINSRWDLSHWNCWRSLGDSNPCFRRERAKKGRWAYVMNFANALKHYAEASQEPQRSPAHRTTTRPSTTVRTVPTLTI